MLQLPEALGNGLDIQEKNSFQLRAHFPHTPLRRLLPEGRTLQRVPPGDLGPEHEDSLVRILCSAISTSVVKSWNHVFNLPCLGNLKRGEKITKITSGLKLMIVTLFYPTAKRNVHISSLFPNVACRIPLEAGRMTSLLFCIVYPKANLEKKEYFTERMGFGKNEVSL